MIRKSKEEIEIEFSKAIDQAMELENLAEDLSRIARGGMESALMILKNNWRGDTGGSIELAGRRTTAEIYSTADDLKPLSLDRMKRHLQKIDRIFSGRRFRKETLRIEFRTITWHIPLAAARQTGTDLLRHLSFQNHRRCFDRMDIVLPVYMTDPKRCPTLMKDTCLRIEIDILIFFRLLFQNSKQLAKGIRGKTGIQLFFRRKG